MAEMKLNVTVDARPALDLTREMTDRVELIAARTMRERDAAYERMHRRHLRGAAGVFNGRADSRRRFDPRRVLDRHHAAACQRIVELSERAEQAEARRVEPRRSAV